MKHHPALALAAIAAAGTFTWAAASRADDTNVFYTPAPAPAGGESTYSGPNRALLASGLIAFTGAYVPSVIVAAASGQSADRHLYVPIVGPWLDLGERPACGIGSIGCDRETTNKVLIIASGAFQGVGALAVLGSFIFPEHGGRVASGTRSSSPKKAEGPTLHVTPAELGAGGYGMVAFGRF